MPNENSIIQALKEIINIIFEYLFKKYPKNVTLSFIILLVTLGLLFCFPPSHFLNTFALILFFVALVLFLYFRITHLILQAKQKQNSKQESNKDNIQDVIEKFFLKQKAANKENIEVVKNVLNPLELSAKEKDTKTFAEKLILKKQKKQKDLFDPNKPSYKV